MFSTLTVDTKKETINFENEFELIRSCQQKTHQTKFLGLNARVNGLAAAMAQSPQRQGEKQPQLTKAIVQINQLQKDIHSDLAPSLAQFTQASDRAYKKLNTMGDATPQSLIQKINRQTTKTAVKFSKLQSQLTNRLLSEHANFYNLLGSEQSEALNNTFYALKTYESIIHGALFIASNNQTVSFQAFQVSSILQERLIKASSIEEKKSIEELIDDVNRVTDELHRTSDLFQNSVINGKTVQTLVGSAHKKHTHICHELEQGKLENANLNLQVALRHEMSNILEVGLAHSKQAAEHLELVENYAQTTLNGLEQDKSNKLANELTTKPELTQSTPAKKDSAPEQQASKQKTKPNKNQASKKLKNQKTQQSTEAAPYELDKKPAAKENQLDLLTIRTGLHNKTQWLKSDLQALQSQTRSSEKKELAKNLQTPLSSIEDRVENARWPKTDSEIKAHKQNIEKELSDLEQLLEQISIADSRPSSPNTTSTLTKSENSLDNEDTRPQKKLSVDASSWPAKQNKQNRKAASDTINQTQALRIETPLKSGTKPLKAFASNPKPDAQAIIKPQAIHAARMVEAPIVHPLDALIQNTTKNVNSLLFRLNQLSMQKHAIQSNLLISQDSLSPVWANIYQAQTIISYLNTAIVECPHSLYIVPYQESLAPASEMLRLIQLQKTHEHFNYTNVVQFLDHINSWSTNYEDFFQKLDYLLVQDPNLTFIQWG